MTTAMPTKALPSHRWQLENGFYRARDLAGMDRLPRYGVTGRVMGDMKEPERRLEALAKAGLERMSPRLLKQIHGAIVLEAKAGAALIPEADGWVSQDPHVALCVYVADCLPIFVWDREGSAVGVCHAGWRGLASGMARAAARAFRRYGLAPDRLCAAVGPHIGACCYEVGLETARRFHSGALKKKSGAADGPEKLFLDLGEEARLQLLEEGLVSDAISLSDDCTACRPKEFFSYRKNKESGRMMAFIAMPAVA